MTRSRLQQLKVADQFIFFIMQFSCAMFAIQLFLYSSPVQKQEILVFALSWFNKNCVALERCSDENENVKLTVATETFIRFIVNSIVKGILFELVLDCFQSLNAFNFVVCSMLESGERFLIRLMIELRVIRLETIMFENFTKFEY